MRDAFIGSEATSSGRLSAYALRSRFVALYPDVYVPTDSEVTAITRAKAAWLWSRRNGVVAGQSAAALHGARWVDARKPAEIIYDNRHRPDDIRTWADRIEVDEVETIDGVAVTTPARTALDLARRYPVDKAVAAIDALSRATKVGMTDVELLAERYRGRRGIRRARAALKLVDAGAESPRETWLRLLLMRAGYPRPTTQIPVHNEYGVVVAVLDMGWKDVKVAAEYDGRHHRDAVRFNTDIRRHDEITDLGWIDVRVTNLDTEAVILQRIAKAWAQRV